MSISKVFGLIALGVVMGIAGAIMLATYMVINRLNAESIAILTGMIIMAGAIGAIVLPFVLLQIESRRADQREFMAMVGKSSGGRLSSPIHISQLPPNAEGFQARAGAFVLPDRDWQDE